MNLLVEEFEKEIAGAVRQYDRHVVCLEKTPDEFEQTVRSLVKKALETFTTRAAGLRHGIALDRQVTVIISESDRDRPLCGIYFNLHSPYSKRVPAEKR